MRFLAPLSPAVVPSLSPLRLSAFIPCTRPPLPLTARTLPSPPYPPTNNIPKPVPSACLSGSGKIVRPTKEEMFFLPQRPYCTLGPLRDQITYPASQDDANAEASADSEDGGGKGVVGEGGGGSEGVAVEGGAGAGKSPEEEEDEELLSLLDKVSGMLKVRMQHRVLKNAVCLSQKGW